MAVLTPAPGEDQRQDQDRPPWRRLHGVLLEEGGVSQKGEEIHDYETRFRALVRKIEKALKAVGSSKKSARRGVRMVSPMNVYMRLEASDTATVRGTASSYKMEDVLHGPPHDVVRSFVGPAKR